MENRPSINSLLLTPVVGISASLLMLGAGFFLPLLVGLKSVAGPGGRAEADRELSSPVAPLTAHRPSRVGDADPHGGGDAVVVAAPVPKPTERIEPSDKPIAGAGKGVPAHAGVVSVVKGKRVYDSYCIACHQAGGTGKVGFAPNIRNRDFLALASDKFLRDTITIGRPGTAMVPWAFLKADEVDSLVAYLRSAESPDATPKATLKAEGIAKADPDKKHPGDAAAGEGLYSIFCASCHGQNASGYAEGGAGPAIGNAGFLAVASDDFIFQTVKHGRVGTSMRGFVGATGLANLDEGQVGDIIAYLRGREATAPVAEARPGEAKAGHSHYNTNCAACHQMDGSGLPGFAPSIRNRDFLGIASDDFIKDTVRNGRPGTAMVQRPDLSEQVLADIVAYLRALPGGQTQGIKVDPTKDYASLGDAQHGEQVYSVFCMACHGEGGKGYVAGGPGTAIGLSGFLDSASDDYILQTLKQGRIGTPMRAFIGARGLANLSEQDAYDIIAYLRNLDN